METKIEFVRRFLYFLLGIQSDEDQGMFDALTKIQPVVESLNVSAVGYRVRFYYLYLYRNKVVRNAIWRMKFNNDKKYREFFAKQLSDEIFKRYESSFVLLPVPTTSSRTRERGSWTLYDLCISIQRNLKDRGVTVQVNSTSLQRHNSPRQSHHRHRADRIRAMQKIFFVNDTLKAKRALTGARIVCIDDVCTTGSTVADVQRVCKEVGCMSFEVWVIAH